MNCPHCDTKNMRGSRFCKKCGKALEATESVTVHVRGNGRASQVFLLIIFFGGGAIELSRHQDWGILLILTGVLALPLGRLKKTSWTFLSRIWVRSLLGALLTISAGFFALERDIIAVVTLVITVVVFACIVKFKRENYLDLGRSSTHIKK